ncbi:A-kinase anchor protein 7 isoform gamma [Orchesella cincta]|uniref:A-kinase anchor protein 7 isoform gamma n=1 Tax=Orchesella cincta TaxID=48709 RepID=A0A1D2N6H4_ORCCI|nr:A-kinase anchor protein 7 isoform gamma [Orchesella cincta]
MTGYIDNQYNGTNDTVLCCSNTCLQMSWARAKHLLEDVGFGDEAHLVTRISHRVLLIGRSVYGSMFGTNPAIKPPPTPPPRRSTFSQSPSPIPVTRSNSDINISLDVNTSTNSWSSAIENASTCVGDMSTNLSALLSASTAGVSGNNNTGDVEQGSSVLDDNNISIMMSRDSELVAEFSSTTNNGLETRCISGSVQNNTHSHTPENDHVVRGGMTAAVVEVTNEMDETTRKRLREKEKRKSRRQAKTSVSGSNDTSSNSAAAGEGSDTGPPSKKEKISQEDLQGTANVSDSVGPAEQDKPKRKNKRRPKKKPSGQGTNTQTEGIDNMGVYFRPNYFIAIQVSNKDILSKVSELQQSFTEKKLSAPWHDLKTTEIFRDAMVPVQKLHFTLHVMHLKEENGDIERAQQVLKDCWSEVCQDFIDDPMDLTIEGLGHFKNNVLFAQIKEERHILRLEKLSYTFQKKFAELKISGDPRPFKPHMTIAKISRSNKLHKKKIRAFPPEMWSGCEETHFGVQRINSLQLLCMAGEDKLTGYYRCLSQLYFQDPLLKSVSSEQVALNENQLKEFPSDSDHLEKNSKMATAPSGNKLSEGRSSISTPADMLYPLGGKPQAIPRVSRKVHPEQEKLDKMFEIMYRDHEVKHGFWSTKRRLRLNYISQRIFFLCAIAGIILTLVTLVWKVMLVEVKNIYQVKVVDPSSPMTESTVEVRTPFIDDIKLLKQGLQCYLLGACLLAIGGIWSYVTMDEDFNLRVMLYFFNIIILILSTAAMVLGPLFPMMTTNSNDEAKSLDKNEYMSREQAVMGSIKYFRSSQCADIDKATAGLADKEKEFGMRTFCDIIKGIIVMFHFMWFTTLFPILAIIVSLLQIIVNKKYWDMRKLCQYKDRTPEQIKADMCTKD